jgi:hypothetical protein
MRICKKDNIIAMTVKCVGSFSRLSVSRLYIVDDIMFTE